VEEAWSRVLAVLREFRDRPIVGFYRRQLEIEGVDTKFIENNRQLLAELLDVILPPDRIVTERGASFDRRYGLREKPSLIRFRILDPTLYVQGLSDVSVPAEELARFHVRGDDVIVTENEVNGLALLPRTNTLVIFGQGYALERLGEIPWLRSRRLHYWSDIDTHGFAMLDRFRAHFPEAKSLMMDRETLLAHQPLWVTEPEPSTESFSRLAPSEHELLRALRRGTFGERIRLEQERISFTWVRAALSRL